MLLSHSLPETQASLALSIFLATFIYEDGATLLAASASASGVLDPWLGHADHNSWYLAGRPGTVRFGLRFRAGDSTVTLAAKIFHTRVAGPKPSWFARHGSFGSDDEPGDSREPVASLSCCRGFAVSSAGVCGTTAICSAVWVCAIFAMWRFIPRRCRPSQSVALAHNGTDADRPMAGGQDCHRPGRRSCRIFAQTSVY